MKIFVGIHGPLWDTLIKKNSQNYKKTSFATIKKSSSQL